MADPQTLAGLSCAVGVLHHDEHETITLDQNPRACFRKFKYSLARLRFLMPLTQKLSITTLYVAQEQYARDNDLSQAQNGSTAY